MGELQPTHLLLVLLVVVLLFGGSRMSQLGKGLGEGIRNFKKGLREDEPERAATQGTAQSERAVVDHATGSAAGVEGREQGQRA